MLGTLKKGNHLKFAVKLFVMSKVVRSSKEDKGRGFNYLVGKLLITIEGYT